MTYDARLVFFCFAFLFTASSSKAEFGTLGEVEEAAIANRVPAYIDTLTAQYLRIKLQEFAKAKGIEETTQKLAWLWAMDAVWVATADAISKLEKVDGSEYLETSFKKATSTGWDLLGSVFGNYIYDSRRAWDYKERARNAVRGVIGEGSSAYKDVSMRYKQWSTQNHSDPRLRPKIAGWVAEWLILNSLAREIDTILEKAYSTSLTTVEEYNPLFGGYDPFSTPKYLPRFLERVQKIPQKQKVFIWIWLENILPVDVFVWPRVSALLASRGDGPLTVLTLLPPRIFDQILSGLFQLHLPEPFQTGFPYTEPPSRRAEYYLARLPVYQAFLDECYKK